MQIVVDKTDSNDSSKMMNGCCDGTNDNGKTDYSQKTIGVLVQSNAKNGGVEGNTTDKGDYELRENH